jgi:hypothetical protein
LPGNHLTRMDLSVHDGALGFSLFGWTKRVYTTSGGFNDFLHIPQPMYLRNETQTLHDGSKRTIYRRGTDERTGEKKKVCVASVGVFFPCCSSVIGQSGLL